MFGVSRRSRPPSPLGMTGGNWQIRWRERNEAIVSRAGRPSFEWCIGRKTCQAYSDPKIWGPTQIIITLEISLNVFFLLTSSQPVSSPLKTKGRQHTKTQKHNNATPLYFFCVRNGLLPTATRPPASPSRRRCYPQSSIHDLKFHPPTTTILSATVPTATTSATSAASATSATAATSATSAKSTTSPLGPRSCNSYVCPCRCSSIASHFLSATDSHHPHCT